MATARTKGINLVGQKSVSQNVRTGQLASTFNVQAVYHIVHGLATANRVDLLDSVLNETRSIDNAKQVGA